MTDQIKILTQAAISSERAAAYHARTGDHSTAAWERDRAAEYRDQIAALQSN